MWNKGTSKKTRYAVHKENHFEICTPWECTFQLRDIWGDHCWYLLVARQCIDILGAVKMSGMILADIKPPSVQAVVGHVLRQRNKHGRECTKELAHKVRGRSIFCKCCSQMKVGEYFLPPCGSRLGSALRINLFLSYCLLHTQTRHKNGGKFDLKEGLIVTTCYLCPSSLKMRVVISSLPKLT
jgi:hypothetical protein